MAKAKPAVTVIEVRIGGTPAARRKAYDAIQDAIDVAIENIELPNGVVGMTTVHEERSYL